MPHPNPRMKNASSAPRERRHRARRRWRWHATNPLVHHTWERRNPVIETYVHDAHGNQTQRSAQTVNRNVRYSARQDAYEITLASMFGTPPRSRFWYGPGGRYKREDSAQGSSTRRTVYLGNVEMITQGGQVQIKRYLAGGLAVQTFDAGLFGRPVTRYLYHDHLGSIVRVADANGALIEGADYGPFGERRGFAHPTGIPAIPETTNKGFTGHEMLDGLDIVHMNGRLYDNRLYRFMQPDPFVQSPGTPQNWNPYSYLWNNPLNGTDPSGYLGVKERQWLGAIIVVVAIVTQQYWLGANAGAGATFAYAVSVGAIAGGVSSGSWEGALWGAFSAAVFYGIGSAFDQVAQANNLAEQGLKGIGKSGLTGGQYAAKALTHGMAGGAMSSLQGGKFGHGFVSAGAAQGASAYIDDIPKATGRVAAAALVGGSASAMTGGKFANGALTAAFSRAFNDEAHSTNEKLAPLTDQERGLLAAGETVEFWKSRLANGDPWARNALGIWDPDNSSVPMKNRLLGISTTNRLMSYMAARDGHYGVYNRLWGLKMYGGELLEIGRELAIAHGSMIDRNGGAAVNLRQSDSYHQTVFGRHNIWPSAYGGTPLGGVLPSSWQSAATNAVFGYCENACRNQ